MRAAVVGVRPSDMDPGPIVCGLEVPYMKVDCLICGCVWNTHTNTVCPECNCPNVDPDREEDE